MKNLISVSGKAESGKDEIGKIIQYLTAIHKTKTNYTYTQFKDSTLEMLSPYQIRKMANKLKQIASILTGIPVEKFEDQEFKKSFLGHEWATYRFKAHNGEYYYIGTQSDIEKYNLYGYDVHLLTVREFLQKLGTESMRNGLHKDTWLNAFWIDFQKKFNWIITDCRFENEYNSIKERGGLMIKVERPIVQYDRTCFDCNKGFNFEQIVSDHKGCPYCEGINYAKVLYEHNNHTSETGLDMITDWDYVIQNDGTIEELICKVEEILIKEKLL